jgi:hypothetical protein
VSVLTLHFKSDAKGQSPHSKFGYGYHSPAAAARRRARHLLRSPVRPNPIGTAVVGLVGIKGATVLVRGLDCLDGTPPLDLKPANLQSDPKGTN